MVYCSGVVRTGILADIHGNAVALDAVLEDGARAEVQRWVSLGDVIGYGPDPRSCLQRLRELDALCVQGNHEARALDLDTAPFNVLAEEAIVYTRGVLGADERSFVRGFSGSIRWGDLAVFCHGSPEDRDEYLVLRAQVDSIVAQQDTRFVFCGHTHRQFWFDGESLVTEPGDTVFDPDHRVLANPGSVGQPRDGDPRAAYAILDEDTGRLSLRRIEYDIEEQITRVQRAGLPSYLGERLRVGH